VARAGRSDTIARLKLRPATALQARVRVATTFYDQTLRRRRVKKRRSRHLHRSASGGGAKTQPSRAAPHRRRSY